MKMQIKRLLTVVLAVALIVGVGYFSWDDQLRASEGDGAVTAAEQQEQAEQTVVPVEVVVPEETPAEEVQAPADPFQNARISVSLTNDGELYYGDIAMLWAQVSGVEGNGHYTIQWQTDNGDGWENIPGATGPSYNFSINGSNATRPYRAVMICQ